MIRKLCIVFLLSMVTAFPLSTYELVGNQVSAEGKEAPEYAKWGKMAMKETMKRYPVAQIKDYQHVWRQQKKNGTSLERFKLWVKDGNREFSVYVTITFDTKTEEVKNVLMIETPN